MWNALRVAAGGATGAQRAAVGNHDLVRHVLAQLFGIIAEWMVVLGVLVYAYDRSGATATGLASLALLVPYVVVGPFAGALATRHPPQRVRVLGFVVQVLGYGVAALSAARDQPLAVVVLAAAVAVAAATSMRPTAAMVLPGLVRSSRELTVGNLWGGYCENLGALGGPVLATALLAIGGPSAVLLGCAALASTSLAVLHVPRPIDPPAAVDSEGHSGVRHLATATLRELRGRSGALTVLVVAGAQFVVVGALDIVIVVVAEDQFGLGEGGPGWLQAAFGTGSLASGLLAVRLSHNRRQARAVGCAIAAAALVALILAGILAPVAAFVLLPILGLAQGLADVLSDVLLHRSVPPERLAGVYALLETASGVGLILGSLIAQVAIAVSGPRLALASVAMFLVIVLAAAVPGLRTADAAADVPVVAMSLLRRVPLFAPLPATALEDVARSATEHTIERGTALTTEGAPGDQFFVVADGAFEATVAGQPVASFRRGGSFGEIALLADVARTATVTATDRSSVLAIERRPFLIAVTGHDSSRQAAWGVMRARGGAGLPIAGPHEFAEADEP